MHYPLGLINLPCRLALPCVTGARPGCGGCVGTEQTGREVVGFDPPSLGRTISAPHHPSPRPLSRSVCEGGSGKPGDPQPCCASPRRYPLTAGGPGTPGCGEIRPGQAAALPGAAGRGGHGRKAGQRDAEGRLAGRSPVPGCPGQTQPLSGAGAEGRAERGLYCLGRVGTGHKGHWAAGLAAVTRTPRPTPARFSPVPRSPGRTVCTPALEQRPPGQLLHPPSERPHGP